MALHAMSTFMMRECNGAVLAFQSFATCPAQHDRRISAAIEQYHYLLFLLDPLTNFLRQLARDHLLVPGLLELLAHVDDLDFRQRPPLHAIGQLEHRELIFLGIEVGPQGWLGGTQHDDGVRHLAPHPSHTTPVIARSPSLLVRRALSFI